MSEYSEARSALQESVEMSRRLFGEANPDYAFALMSLGRACQFSSDFITAEAHYRKAIAIFRELPKRYELKMGVALNNLGNLLILEDRDDEALAVLREADHLFFQLQGETYFLMTARMYLCKAYWKKGDYEQAIDSGAKATELARRFHFEGSPDFIYALEYLGMSLIRTGKAQEAEPLLRESLAGAERDFPKEDGKIAVVEGALGECLAAQERLAEAEPLILHSYESLQKTSGKFSIVTPSGKIDLYQKWRTLAAKRTVDLYVKWQKPDLAAKYRAMP